MKEDINNSNVEGCEKDSRDYYVLSSRQMLMWDFVKQKRQIYFLHVWEIFSLVKEIKVPEIANIIVRLLLNLTKIFCHILKDHLKRLGYNQIIVHFTCFCVVWTQICWILCMWPSFPLGNISLMFYSLLCASFWDKTGVPNENIQAK